jgi:hypothetical protein
MVLHLARFVCKSLFAPIGLIRMLESLKKKRDSSSWFCCFAVARHKSLDVFPPARTGTKTVGLSLSEVAAIIRQDFDQRQYYVTGRLTKRIYTDDCFFDAPDPDMPVSCHFDPYKGVRFTRLA